MGEFAIGLQPVRHQTDEGHPVRREDRRLASTSPLAMPTTIALNGNRSNVHWDMVLIQTPEWGGGEIFFDDVLIRKDGRFVIEELKGLNPEKLA